MAFVLVPRPLCLVPPWGAGRRVGAWRVRVTFLPPPHWAFLINPRSHSPDESKESEGELNARWGVGRMEISWLR